MALLTENTLSNTLDIPVNLPATEVQMGDWLIVSSINLVAPMQLTYQFMTLQMLASSVSTQSIVQANMIVPSLDYAFIGLYVNYSSGHPANSPALDILRIRQNPTVASNCVPIPDTLGQFISVRSSPTLTFKTPGVYSFIVANNMQPSAQSTIPTSTSIDFQLVATGQIRLALNSA